MLGSVYYNADYSRGRLRVLWFQVRQEQVTGGVLMALLGLDMANVYQNLTNIVMTLTPKRHQDIPAVLVNAHYDTAVGSPGESTSSI